MKRTLYFLFAALVILTLSLSGMGSAQASPLPQAATETPAPQATEPPPANVTSRPVMVMGAYYPDVEEIKPGMDFNLVMTLTNTGQSNAYNIILTFTPGDMIPRGTGGTLSVTQIVPGETKTVIQPLTASPALTAGAVSSMSVGIAYTDQSNGTPYSSDFNLSFRIASPTYSGGPARPTATPTAVLRPQLVISGYETDKDSLQPGTEFELKIDLRNLGNADARGITMVVGGGSIPSGGTPDPNVPGTGGDFSIFAPLRASNIQALGDLQAGAAIEADQSLIVNVTANPGAYSVKFAFVYTDGSGVRYVDDQVITLLIYSLPLVEVNFYRDPNPIFAGQPSALPLQVVNLGRKTAVLGNMTATTTTGMISNNTTLVGAMDPGMYFPLDAMLIADQPGPLDIMVKITYTDDFNQPRIIEQTLTVDVLESAPMEPPMDGGEGMGPGEGGGGVDPGMMPVEPETFWQKVTRFFRGLFGLDSGSEQPVIPGEGMPIEGPIEGPEGRPIIEPAAPAPAKG